MKKQLYKNKGLAPLLIFLLAIFNFNPVQAQNSYPSTGNAVINGVTVGSTTNSSFNSLFGTNALSSNTTGSSNTAIGFSSMQYNTTGSYNTALGLESLIINTTGSYNTATGYQALLLNNTGNYNTATGYQALLKNTAGANTATGYQALYSNSSGTYNTAIGMSTLYSDTSGSFNVAVGGKALASNTSGGSNVATGNDALNWNTTGYGNTASGAFTLETLTTGSYNTGVGFNANSYDDGTISNSSAFGANTFLSASNQIRLGNGNVTSIGGVVGWSNISDARVKKNIKQNVPGLAFINLLEPITYNLDLDAADRIMHAPTPKTAAGGPSSSAEAQAARKAKEQVIYSGFKAQDVEKASKSIGYEFSGVDAAKNSNDLYCLRYGEFVVPLVKAVQELSRKNDSLVAANAQLSDTMAQLSNRLANIEQLLGITANSSTEQLISMSSAKLFQNIPNPFGQGTTISYYLPVSTGTASIQVTDIKGDIIKTIPLGSRGAGQVNLQTAQLGAGTYTYSLLADGTLVDTKKMILVK